MIMILPVLIATLQGYCLLGSLIPQPARPRVPLMLFWGALIGTALTVLLAFLNLLLFGQLNPIYTIVTNVLVLAGLIFLARTRAVPLPFGKNCWQRFDLIGLHLIILAMIPVVLHARLYPHGGWDAWSCWNLKAVMISTAGNDWQRMFDPALWRSNTAYPFFLPLVNAWSWCFGSTPNLVVPLVTSCRITFLTAILLFFGLKEITRQKTTLLAPLWMLSISFVIKLASSQYSDLLIGTWLLSALLALRLFAIHRAPAYLSLFIISLGCLSFTKSEGLVLTLITAFWSGIYILLNPAHRATLLPAWKGLLITSILSFLPAAIFVLFWAPESTTFINGLTSADKPTHIMRLFIALRYLGIELVSLKWNGFWLLALGAALLGWKRSWQRTQWVIPAILFSYIASLMAVYFVNTFFPIVWWLSTTLNRLIFALIPPVLFWIFLANAPVPKEGIKP
jgi:hypothetical protein